MKELFVSALFTISVLTTLTVEGIKKLLDEMEVKYNANILACIVSVVLSIVVTVSYIIFEEQAVTLETVSVGVALCFFSWLSSMLGFDKVKQTLEKIGSGE